ncbi:AraC family transcriptional regulator [Botrimarina mediterranea]|uniref:Xylose operon regulatory protein n=1 Tax=Botrimarina mediterranea TaxID=2528022 RepID=A0A518K9G9_9BACT|nr:AraC family transcriptional regulator [Botrimarina mediterranea]QDV74442.1 Xylose operon regulatory protein [Botrimarina mediterranea]QDV79038.1 Xylose operon regulatory protein [Planctomycetes bacterium K2D]
MTTICSGVLINRSEITRLDVRPTAKRSGRESDRVRPARVTGPGQGAARFFRYLPDRNGDVTQNRVTGVGRDEVRPGDCYPPRNHPTLYAYSWRTGRTLPEHQVLLLTGANGEFESEATGPIRLMGDVLIFLLPGVWHRYRPMPGGGWTERWVSLHGDAVTRRLRAARVSPTNCVFGIDQSARLRGGYDGLIDLVQRGQATGVGVMPFAFSLLDEALRQSTETQCQATETQPVVEEVMAPQEEQVQDEIVRQALEIIWNHEHNPPLGVNDVARKLPVTRRTLDRRFSEVLGRTVLDEINACRLSRAKRLLADTDSPIKAVAYLAGFPSRERLRLAFLTHEGMPPSEYREAIRKARPASVSE